MSLISSFNLKPSQPRRIPPKTSISQQLLSLNGALSLPSNPPEQKRHPSVIKEPGKPISQPKQTSNGDDEEEHEEEVEEKDEDFRGFVRPKSAAFSFGKTGPFEPLVLSSPGDIPVHQVITRMVRKELEPQIFLLDRYLG